MRCSLAVTNSLEDYMPSRLFITHWLNTAFSYENPRHLEKFDEVQIELEVVGPQQIQQLNQQYRHIDKPTNILSFNLDNELDTTSYLLGSLVVCSQVMRAQASTANKSAIAHWAHIIIHGCFHLLGYDHQDDLQEKIMIEKEVTVLEQLGFNYQLAYSNI